jgi:proteasome lid subunit RPN8/RPN11
MRLIEVPVDMPRSTVDLLALMANCELPYEACGVVYRDGRVVQYPNQCDEPEHGFDALVPLTDDIDIIWHSHPNGMAWPSRQDMPMINAHPQFRWLIVTPDGSYMYVMR